MANKVTKLTWQDVRDLIKTELPKKGLCYGVPRGGAIVAALTGRETADPFGAEFLVDDIVDSGATKERWKNYEKPFHALVDKRKQKWRDAGWVHFPWEEPPSVDAESSVVRLLQFLGEDPSRDGLKETPKRVVKAWTELTAGYKLDPAAILSKEFESDGYDEMVVCKSIEFHSTCEHHMLPFLGVAHVGYIPRLKVVGLSKMARLVDCFARRLQVQERLTRQVAGAMQRQLKPRGVGVVVEAKHLCMSCRGVQKHQSSMVTSTLLGVFRQTAVRAEFLNLLKQ
jgi:GTP cyclohydrolase I